MLADARLNWPEWYQASGEYSGPGTVYSDEIGKQIEGQFSVTWNDCGECRIRCLPNNLNMIELLQLAGEFDRFRDLSIGTSEGQFSAKTCYLDGLTLGFPSPSEVRYITLAGAFVCADVTPAFWDAPVVNLVSQFRVQESTAEHPLRPKQAVGFCQFRYCDSMAFVDYLPDYEEKRQKLERGTSTSEVTCMMTGFVPSGVSVDTESVLNWFPSDAFAVLSLASSTSVGLGLIELRGLDGRLHSRVHVCSLREGYVAGPVVVGDFAHGASQQSGLGPLISATLAAKAEALDRVRLLCDAITASKSELQTPERAFSTIVRALDGISNQLQLNRRHLLQELTGSESDQVRRILIDARNAVKKIAQQMTGAGKVSAEIATVERIASRVEQADAIEDSFGLTLPRLLAYYRLKDEQAIADCYAAHPRSDGLSWPSALSKYRAGAIHKGRIDSSGGVPMTDLVSITKHLIDVATRICLKESGYLGTYNPFNDAATQIVDVDWVSNAQHAELFSLGGKAPSMFRRVGF